MIRFALTICILAFSISPIFAKEYTLADLLSRLDSSPALFEAQAGVAKAAASQIRESSDAMDTMIGYQAMDAAIVTNGAVASDMLAHKFTLRQPVIISGRVYFAGQAANAELKGSQASLDQLKLKQRNDLVTLYRELMVSRQMLANRRQEAQFLQRLKEQAQTRLTTGSVGYSVLSGIELKRIQALNVILDLEQENLDRLIALQNMLGIRESDFTIADSVPLEPAASPKVELMTLYQNYTDTSHARQVMLFDIEKQKNLADSARGTFIPDLSFMGELTVQPTGALNFSAGVEINLPLFSLPIKIAGVDVAEKSKAQLEAALNAADNDAYHQLQALLARLSKGQQKLALLRDQALKWGDANLSLMLQDYQLQKGELASVFEALTMVFELKDQYYSTLLQVQRDQFDLDLLTGSNK